MNKIEDLIKSLERDIEQLETDIFYTTHSVTTLVIRTAIDKRKDRIKELRRDYLGEKVND